MDRNELQPLTEEEALARLQSGDTSLKGLMAAYYLILGLHVERNQSKLVTMQSKQTKSNFEIVTFKDLNNYLMGIIGFIIVICLFLADKVVFKP